MRLFIAALLIWKFGLQWWWYAIAFVAYTLSEYAERIRHQELKDALFKLRLLAEDSRVTSAVGHLQEQLESIRRRL